MAIEMMLT